MQIRSGLLSLDVCAMVLHLLCCTLLLGDDAHMQPHLWQCIGKNCAKNIFFKDHIIFE